MVIFQLSVTGSVVILFIALVRVLAIHRLPKITFWVLWLVAALRLLVPLTVHVPDWFHLGSISLLGWMNDLPAGNGAIASDGVMFSPSTAGAPFVLFVVWVTGVFVATLYVSLRYIRSLQKFRVAIPDETPVVQDWLAEHRICRGIQVRISDQILSPLTYGVLRPVILLPKKIDRNDAVTLRYVLTHEYVHVRRFDAVIKILFAAVLCIHWFNPLVWLMYVLAERDMELSCDACVIRTTGECGKSSYALALISMAESRVAHASLHSYFSNNIIKERIESIMRYKKTSMAAIALAIVLVLGATSAFAVSTGRGGTTLKVIGPENDGLTITEEIHQPNLDEYENDDAALKAGPIEFSVSMGTGDLRELAD